MNAAELKQEIEGGALRAELAPLIRDGNDQAVADRLNRPDRTYQRRVIDSRELTAIIDRTEWAALPAADKQWLQLIVAAPTVDLAAHRATLSTMFPVGGPTRAAIAARIQRQGSRAEEQWGDDTRVTADDVQRALRPVQAGVDEGAGGRRITLLPDDQSNDRMRAALVEADGTFIEWRSA